MLGIVLFFVDIQLIESCWKKTQKLQILVDKGQGVEHKNKQNMTSKIYKVKIFKILQLQNCSLFHCDQEGMFITHYLEWFGARGLQILPCRLQPLTLQKFQRLYLNRWPYGFGNATMDLPVDAYQ